MHFALQLRQNIRWYVSVALCLPFLCWWLGIWRLPSPYWQESHIFWIIATSRGSLVVREPKPPTLTSLDATDSLTPVASCESTYSRAIPNKWTQWWMLGRFVPSPTIEERWTVRVWPGRVNHTKPQEVRIVLENTLGAQFVPLLDRLTLDTPEWRNERSVVRFSQQGLIDMAMLIAFVAGLCSLCVLIANTIIASNRRARGACVACGYPLEGCSGRCPECGATVINLHDALTYKQGR